MLLCFALSSQSRREQRGSLIGRNDLPIARISPEVRRTDQLLLFTSSVLSLSVFTKSDPCVFDGIVIYDPIRSSHLGNLDEGVAVVA